MIQFTPDTQIKIDLVDDLITSMSVEEIKNLADQQKNVNKLRGTPVTEPVINKLKNEIFSQEMRITSLHSELMVLREDMKMLIRALSTPVAMPYTYSSDFSALKSKHHIY